MTNIELRVRSIINSLSNSEKKVAEYFLNNVDSVFNMPIAQLAAKTGVSQVAWVRFCKAIGFDGLKDLKKRLFSEMNESAEGQEEQRLIFSDIKDFTSVEQMIETVKRTSIQAIEDTMQLLDAAIIEKAARKIVQCDCVKIFGVGASAIVCEDLANKLQRIGKNVCFCRDFHIQLTYAANMTKRDVGLFISHSGTTKEIVETLALAKGNSAVTIAVTKFGKSPLAVDSDFQLTVSSPEIDRRSGAMSSRISQLAVIDILFTAVANRDYANVESKLESSYESCSRHKVR